MTRAEEWDMWDVNQGQIGKIRTVLGMRIFMHLWETMDEQTQAVAVHLPEGMIAGKTRQTIWRAFADLEENDLIRRLQGARKFEIVFINPEVVKPHWLKGERLQATIDGYQKKVRMPYTIKEE